MERQSLQIRREYHRRSQYLTESHQQYAAVAHRLSLLRHSMMFFLSTLLSYLQVSSPPIFLHIIGLISLLD